MRLTLQNHIVCADYGQVHLDARVVGQIMNSKIRDHLSGRGESASERRIYLPVRAGKV